MKKIIIFIVFLSLIKCKSSVDIQFIKSTGWLYYSGYRIIEYMDFDKEIYSIKGDTIFYQNKPVALIIKLNKTNYDLTIKSLDTGEVGHYMDEREMQK